MTFYGLGRAFRSPPGAMGWGALDGIKQTEKRLLCVFLPSLRRTRGWEKGLGRDPEVRADWHAPLETAGGTLFCACPEAALPKETHRASARMKKPYSSGRLAS